MKGEKNRSVPEAELTIDWGGKKMEIKKLYVTFVSIIRKRP